MDSRSIARPSGIGAFAQMWSFRNGRIQGCREGDRQCQQPQPCLIPAHGIGPAVVKASGARCSDGAARPWAVTPVPGSRSLHQFSFAAPSGQAGLCLSSRGPFVVPPVDPWCVRNNNMWRSSTDTLQTWTRLMVEVESVANQGHISRPGAWSFPDCLEVGVPGQGTLTWEETKTNVALFAVTSSPLILGNDPRPGRMQQRLVQLLTNPEMLRINQEYQTDGASFAGGRLATWPVGRELWAKPLPGRAAAVVLFNRAGTVFGVTPSGADPKPPHCSDPNSTLAPCHGCFVNDDRPWLSPCDDDAAASIGAQKVTFHTDQLPRDWLVLDENATVPGSPLVCDIFDIFDTAAAGKTLGRFSTWSAVVPPHGVRFIKLTGCK